MLEAVLCILIIGGFFILRAILATVVGSIRSLDVAADDRTQGPFTPGLRGMTDQSVLVFRKPKK